MAINPTWRQPKPAVRQTLNRDLIVQTALKIIDADGLDGLSMRRVAEALNTGAASLYAHVENKDQLLELVLEEIYAEIELPEPDPARWQEQIRELCRASFNALAAHRDVARVSLANIPTGYHALKIGERFLQILLAGGMPPRYAALAVDRISLYITADAYEGSLFQNRVPKGADPESFVIDYIGQIKEFYLSLPPDEFPTLSANAHHMISGDGDARFEFGLDMLIRSLASYLPAPQAQQDDHDVDQRGQRQRKARPAEPAQPRAK